MFYRIDTLEVGRINPITQMEWDNSWIVLILTDKITQEMLKEVHPIGFELGDPEDSGILPYAFIER